MTIIKGIEIDNIYYNKNNIKYTILNNDPIEEKLNVIVVVSNPCLYARRYNLLKEFVNRMEEEKNVRLFIVELIYDNQVFMVTDKNNKHHLQIKTYTPLWHKENMINLGVKYLIPKDYKAFAWIDADIEFENTNWAVDTLKILNGSKDVVQLFSHCADLNYDGTNLNLFNGFGYSFIKNKKFTSKGLDYWHPGYAWAITKKAYEKIGGLFDKGILGSGDNIMALAFINNNKFMTHKNYNCEYNECILKYQENAKMLRLGYTPGVIQHYFHGSKINRRYTERWKILMKHQYSPKNHLVYDELGILIPNEKFPNGLKEDIMNYFLERKEDD